MTALYHPKRPSGRMMQMLKLAPFIVCKETCLALNIAPNQFNELIKTAIKRGWARAVPDVSPYGRPTRRIERVYGYEQVSTVGQLVLSAIRAGHTRCGEIAAAVDISKNHCSMVLIRLHELGHVTRKAANKGTGKSAAYTYTITGKE